MSGVATMRAMIELGLSDEQKLVLIAAIEADAGPSRTGAAERQRRYRQRQKGASVTNDVTRYDNGDASLSPSPNKSPPDPQKLTPTPVATRRVIPPRAKHAVPDGVSAEQWDAFLRLRAAKRQPMTDRGYSLLCGKLRDIAEHGFPPGEMIDLAIERGWTTIHEPKNGNGNGYHRDERDPTTVALELLAAQDRARENPQAGGADFDERPDASGLAHRGH